MLFAPKFLVAIVGSLPKNSSPSTNTLFTSLPCEVIEPFLSTSIPGNFLSKSSTTAFSFVLKESAKKTKVSPLKNTGSLNAYMVTSFIISLFSGRMVLFRFKDNRSLEGKKKIILSSFL